MPPGDPPGNPAIRINTFITGNGNPLSGMMRFQPVLFLFGILLSVIVVLPAMAVQPSWTIAAAPGQEFSSVVISADGSTIVAGGDQLAVVSANGTKLWAAWSGAALDVSGNGRYIVTSQGPAVRLFDRNGFLLWDQSPGPTVRSVSITPDGLMIAAGGGSTIESWHNSGSGLGLNYTETVRSIRISPARDQIIVSTNNALRAFNISLVPRWYDDTISPGSIGISGDGTRIVVQNGNHVRMYHGGGTLLWDRQIPGGNIIALVYSRDGSTVVVGRDDNTVVSLDREGNLLWTATMSAFAGGVATSDNGSVTAAGTVDNNLYVYDQTGSTPETFRAHGPLKSSCVAVSGDGSLIAATDGLNLYGFERSLFLSPVLTPAPFTHSNSSGGIPMTAAVPEGPVSVPATLLTVTPKPPAPPKTTPAAGYPPDLSLIALTVSVLLVAKQKGLIRRDY
jgi:WD40 repeat protein